ncbi:Probable UDP-N-acetylglucosamine--peptide N-acetylglucosaminyltransferase SPINDLY [Striga hermonthica]|uniref:Probable UDP-N-acetylglucosamine--peptide N-acetylglucosaminyltransferase SPINDLY n=1 Tax=Striga hermonthica TaxID=68872 RepID=A0A9N7NWN0_STRHE|nr:Probable UDP-N-acetylglucosamine--peptide N-acetylglucosaminyltransferase SPINDLY [Striga hermonthica]
MASWQIDEQQGLRTERIATVLEFESFGINLYGGLGCWRTVDFVSLSVGYLGQNPELSGEMGLTEKDVDNEKVRDAIDSQVSVKKQPSIGSGSPLSISGGSKCFKGKDALSYANILRSRNKFVDAFAVYESVLERECENVEAHIGKGICLQMQNLGRVAYESFAEAVRLDPENACALTHCGILYKDEGRLVEAAEMYQKALKADPSYKLAAECLAIVLTDLGTSLKLAGNSQEGIQKYYEAIKIDPHYAPAYYNLGVVYSEMMQYDTALSCYERAAIERPMYAEAYCNMGVIYKNRGDLESAIACYDRCLTVSPNFEIAKNNMAIALTDLGTKVKLEGDINQGVAYYKKALCYNWHYADAMYNLGVAYGEMLKFDMAIVFYELAFHFNPHCAEACNNLGVIYKDRDNLDKAVECYQMALSIKPNFSQSLNNLGVVYTVQGKMDAAASMIEKAIVANPTYAEAYNNLGVLYRDAGNISLAVEAYEQCLKIDPDSRNAGQNRLLALNYIYEGADDKLYETHRDWGRRFLRLFPQYNSWDNIKDPERPLVIAYVSPDYFTHSVSYFIEAPIIYHDYANYKVVVYSAVVKADAKTNRFRDRVLKNGGTWRDIYGIDEKKVASLVREDKIDILVELTGHTANNKLGMMACRPAPVQVTWIGYPNTTGLPTIDYRITDALADPVDTKQKHVEELVRLPDSFLCYTPSPEAGPVSPAPALANGFVTFGSFNNLAKITPKVLQVWAKILCAVPNSRLIVKCKPFCCDSVRQQFLTTLEKLGLDSLRVDLLPLIILNHDHMQAYSLMDISLDTFPYAGTTTTCESLYMGVPCVTMGGSVHAHNVGVSLLKTVGLSNLVAKNEDEYVQMAVQLASDLNALSSLRMRLRDLMLKSPLCDGSKFTRGLESAFRNMWRRYCKDDVPSLRRMEMEQLCSQQPLLDSQNVAPQEMPGKFNASANSPIKANGFKPEQMKTSSREENGSLLKNSS